MTHALDTLSIKENNVVSLKKKLDLSLLEEDLSQDHNHHRLTDQIPHLDLQANQKDPKAHPNPQQDLLHLIQDQQEWRIPTQEQHHHNRSMAEEELCQKNSSKDYIKSNT